MQNGSEIMSIKESGEMYLETILILSKDSKNVRAIDICEYMDFSKPSVSRALKKLSKEGYISVNEMGYISLIGEGKKIAEKIYERHTVITKALICLGVDKKTAQLDACKIEHDISDKTFKCIKKKLIKN